MFGHGGALYRLSTGKRAVKESCESESRLVTSDYLQPHGLHSPWNSPGQNTGVVSLSLLQGIFPTQGLNPGLHIAGDSLPAEQPGKQHFHA